MRIQHHILVESDVGSPLFSECGVEFHQGAPGTISFDIAEDDPRWICVADALERYKAAAGAIRGLPVHRIAGDRVWTEFTDQERNSAPFLEMVPAWHHGYPQPDSMKLDAPTGPGKIAYLKRTYDYSDACEKCWAGAVQIAPFRIKKEPAWGRKSILQLNWEFEEFFVKPEVYETIFRPFGIASRPAVLHSTGSPLQTAVQLSVDEIADVDVEGIPFETCSVCGRRNYQRSTRGFRPKPVDTAAALFKSAQYFHAFDRRVYVSNALYRRIAEAQIQGAEFFPCDPKRS